MSGSRRLMHILINYKVKSKEGKKRRKFVFNVMEHIECEIKHSTFIPMVSSPFVLLPSPQFIARSRVYAVENAIAYVKVSSLRENEFSSVNVREINPGE